VSDNAEGAFGAGPLAYIPLVFAELSVCDGAEGIFDAGPPTVSLIVAPRRQG
jgi:hypothetical protein